MRRRLLFAVQGEGRGHMTQAIALRDLVSSGGHEVVGVMIGYGRDREIPEFVLRSFPGTPVEGFRSPGFAFDAKGRGVLIGATMKRGIVEAPAYRRSLALLGRRAKELEADTIVSFYEPLSTWAPRFLRPRPDLVCIGHQFIFLHPDFRFPRERNLERHATVAYTRLAGAGARRKLALSYYPLPPDGDDRLAVVPPLLRREVLEAPITDRGHLLCYLVNSGYAEEIVRWHEKRPEIPIHCFWDRKDAPEVLEHDATLSFHRLDDRKFIELMASARGLVCTAGFESVAEAMYMGKPVCMIPVEGHYEQFTNARDAFTSGAGIFSRGYDIDEFLRYLTYHEPVTVRFRPWVDSARERFLELLA